MNPKFWIPLALACALTAASAATGTAQTRVTTPEQAQAATAASQAKLDALIAKAQDESAMDGLYGNTVILTHPSGLVIHFHFTANKTFTATFTGGAAKPASGKPAAPAGGTFKIVNRQLVCLAWTGAAATGKAACLPMGPAHDPSDTWVIKPGDTWSDGGNSTYAIVPGIQ